MKAYLIVTGGIFALLGMAHLARLFLEPHPSSDTAFFGINLAVSVLGVGVSLWAARLLIALRGQTPDNHGQGA